MFAQAVKKTKLLEEKARKCMFCLRRLREITMEEHYRKNIKGNSHVNSVNFAAVNIEKRCLKTILSSIIYILKMNTTSHIPTSRGFLEAVKYFFNIEN